MHHVFFNDFVFWTSVPNHEQNKLILMPEILSKLEETKNKQIGKWQCDVNTEFFDDAQKNEKYIGLIVKSIYPALDQMFLELPLKTPKQSRVENIWFNYYKPGQNQEIHNHKDFCSISGIYILSLSEPNKTVFYSASPINGYMVSPAKNLTEAKEGDIVLFPSHLNHYVLPCEKNRITIAFNITCEF